MPGISACTFELRMIRSSGGEQRVIPAGRIANHTDTLRFDSKGFRIRPNPADGGRRTNPEPLRRSTSGQAAVHCRDEAGTKILR